MVWGTSSARRHAPTDPVAAPVIPQAQCANCERWTVFAAGELPRGWVTIEGEALCPDCAPPLRAPPMEPARATDAREASGTGWRRVRLHIIGRPGDASRYRGCRVAHEVALERVGLRIHAGAAAGAPAFRDEPIQFTLDRRELDELIRHLRGIRKELP